MTDHCESSGCSSSLSSSDCSSQNRNDCDSNGRNRIGNLEVHAGGMGIILGASFIVAEIAGAGLLNLPYAISKTGWGGLGLVLFLGIMVTYSGSRLAECWNIMEINWPFYKQTKHKNPYQEIGFRALGKYGRIAVEIALHINLLGASVVYLILISNMMEGFIENVTDKISPLSSCELLIIICLVTIPITWLASPKDVWWASCIAVASMLVTLVVVMYYMLTGERNLSPTYDSPTFMGFFLGFSSILFCFGGASMFPSIQNDMKERSTFSFSIVISFGFLTALYLGVGAGIYYMLGDTVPENVISSVDGKLVAVAEIMLAIHFFFAYIITVNPSMQGLENLLSIGNGFSLYRVCIRSGISLMLLLIGLLIPDFGKLLDFLGASTVSLMSFAFPPLFYWKLVGSINPCTNQPHKILPILEKILLVSIFLLGVFGGGISTYSAGKAIFEGGAFNSTCFSKQEFFND